jgi:hypothetical protein
LRIHDGGHVCDRIHRRRGQNPSRDHYRHRIHRRGAIFKDKDKVSGTASAASIWNTGAIGIAVAFDRFEIAIVLSALNFITLWAVGRLKRNVVDSSQDD